VVEKFIKDSFKEIFGLKKVTFNRPDPDIQEQDVLFVEATPTRPSIRDGVEQYRVEGRGFCFVQDEKMPMGFFAKKIRLAKNSVTKPFFFFNIDSNESTYLNIGQRGFEFVLLYTGQYNPPAGNIESIVIQE